MKVVKALTVGVVVATTLCAAYSFGQAQRAVLNAKQLGIEDLDLDLGLDEDLFMEVAPDEAEPDTPTLVEEADEALVVETEPVAELAIEQALADDPVEDADVVIETVDPVVELMDEFDVEFVPEGVAADEPLDEIEEAPVVEAIAIDVDEIEEAPVVEAIAIDVDEIALPVEIDLDSVVEVPAVEVEEVVVLDELDVGDDSVLVVADEMFEVEPELLEAVETVPESPVDEITLQIADLLDDSDVVVDDTPEELGGVESADEGVEPVQVEFSDPVVAPESVVGAEAVADVTAEDIVVSELATIEIARRKLFDQHGRDCLSQGEAAQLVGNWDRAIDKFKEALKFLHERDATIVYRKQAEAGLAEAYFRKAKDLQAMNNFTDAERSARESKSFGHPRADRLLTEIQDFRDNPPPPPPPMHEKRWTQPEYREMMVDIRERMKIAKEYYATDELAKCRGQVELILRDFPWYKDAVSMLRKVSIAEHKYVDNERVSAREQMIKDVTKAWSARTYGKDFSEGEGPITSGGGASGGPTSLDMRLIVKMREIIIPEIDFRQANITDVVTFLSEASREHDRADVPLEERGVNIVLNLGGGGAAASVSPADSDPFATPFGSSPTASTGGVPPLTINARFLSLLSALDMIMDLADLKYRVRDNVVLIMEASKPDGDLIHRMYNVLPSIQERVVQISSAAGQGGGGRDPFALSAGETTETTDWKKFFGELGVSWPDGSTCQYMSSIGKLVVKNTSRNLATLEEVLAVLNVTPKQVEIEVRFVEVMQSDLDSLGFEWNLNDDWEIAEMKKDSHLPAASRRRVTMGAGSITRGFNYLSQNTAKDINDGSAVLDNVATFTSILTNPELSLVLHMLSSKQNTDLLSAPKVVAQAGFTATIKVVTEYIYPTEYNVEMLESTTGYSDTTTYSGAVVEPQSFVMREVGVILEVTPEVTPDGSMINLTLSPSVVSEPTWKNYGSTYPVSTATGTDLLGNQTFQTEYVQLPMEQPFFPVRSVATSVQIYNDATVVMGGMITEERYTNEDKIPFLGDIPLLGYFFRNKYELSEKRNLLLFVTARLVDPGGRIIKDATTSSVLPLGGAGN